MAKPTLLSYPTCLHLHLLDASDTAITAVVITTSQEAECPLCHQRSVGPHSRSIHQVADLPWMGCAVRLELHVRHFFCSSAECVRHIFTKRVPTVVAPYARGTTRLTDVFTFIGFALGGEAGKRLMTGMDLSTSPDTLLRLIRAQPEEQAPTPRILGGDDFSFCKRKSYRTILIDLERRIPIDMLPDREAATLETWLKAHEGVEVISRDRGGPAHTRREPNEDHQTRNRSPTLASAGEPFRSPETLVCSHTSPAQSAGPTAIRDVFARGGEATPTLHQMCVRTALHTIYHEGAGATLSHQRVQLCSVCSPQEMRPTRRPVLASAAGRANTRSAACTTAGSKCVALQRCNSARAEAAERWA